MPSRKGAEADLLVIVQVAKLMPQYAAHAVAERPHRHGSEPDRIRRPRVSAEDEGDGEEGWKQVRPGGVRQQPEDAAAFQPDRGQRVERECGPRRKVER